MYLSEIEWKWSYWISACGGCNANQEKGYNFFIPAVYLANFLLKESILLLSFEWCKFLYVLRSLICKEYPQQGICGLKNDNKSDWTLSALPRSFQIYLSCKCKTSCQVTQGYVTKGMNNMRKKGEIEESGPNWSIIEQLPTGLSSRAIHTCLWIFRCFPCKLSLRKAKLRHIRLKSR